jgi:PAS domain S-box-containing protein
VSSYLNFGASRTRDLLDRIAVSTSAHLTKCPTHAIDDVIVGTLKELCWAEGADHAAWIVLGRTPTGIERLDTVSTAEKLNNRDDFDSRRLPWVESCLLSGDSVIFASLAELPDKAQKDRVYLDGFGVRSLALFPIDGGEANFGVLAVASLNRSGSWSTNLSKPCYVLGRAFLSARSRKLTHLRRESNFREAFQHASVGMALEDTAGGMLYVNEALCTMLGYSETEMMRMKCVDVSHPGDLQREAVLFDQLSKGERQSYEMEKRFLNRSGATIWGNVNVTLVKQPADQPPLVLGIVEDITARQFALEESAKSQLEVQALVSRVMLSQEDERRSIARELHDDIGQRLSLLTSEFHSLRGTKETADQMHSRSLECLAGELDMLVSDLQALSHRLYSSKLEHLGIQFALRDVCRCFKRAGLAVNFKFDDAMETPATHVAVCLIRIAEEALSNVLQHSGTSQAELSLVQQTDGYSLTIVDAGKGFDTHAHADGLGLVSIRERVRSFHGRLTIRSLHGEGTRITVWLPFQALAA